jgi:nitrate/TMAO reductase-like tetraheme cytochrome c subunit
MDEEKEVQEEKKGERKQNTWQDLTKTSSYFFKAFSTIIKRGAIQHKRGLQIGFIILFLFIVMFSFAMLKFTETAFFCGSCHKMKEYVESWKVSSHKNVGCIDCHYKPGFINHLKGKWKDGTVSLVYVISGKIPPRSHAQIEDESCLQSKCHSKEELKKDILFKNVVFNHEQHLEEVKRGKKLRCTTCHSQIVQGAHLTVTEGGCFICHFYKEKGQKELPAFSKCTACHFEAKGEIKIQDFVFNHKNYIKRGIACEKCHAGVVVGDGRPKENTCVECHEKKEHIETKYTAEYLHAKHVTERKVECFTCHATIKHEIKKLSYRSEQGECVQCHRPEDHHDDIVNMYTGKGAKFVEDTPSRKASLNMDCNMCHEASRDKSHIQAKCSGCHGGFTDGMVNRWNKILKDKQEEMLKEILAVKALAAQKNMPAKVRVKIDDAMFNYSFIGKGVGSHNIIYSMKIYHATMNVLKEVRAKIAGDIVALAPFKLSCTYVCHGDISEKKVKFGSVNYPHAPHVEGDASCANCHSQYYNHGKTTLKGCSNCHHGEGAGKVSCKDCHKDEANMFDGKGVKGIKEATSPMHAKANCTNCHEGVKSGKHSLAAVKATCSKCHKKGSYEAKIDEWVKQNKTLKTKYLAELAQIDKDIHGIEDREGAHIVPFRVLHEELTEEIKFLSLGGFNHNHFYSTLIVEKIDKHLEKLKKMIKDKKAGKKIVLN